MPKVRQMSEVFLRGSLANVTMKNLTDEQQRKINELLPQICDHPALAGHKHEFIYRLGTTIACDYRSDSSQALEEYQIAIWRALVHLLYHSDYLFHCKLCTSSSYPTQRGKPAPINRQFEHCPNCKHAVVSDVGTSTLVLDMPVTPDQFQFVIEELQKCGGSCSSCCVKSCSSRGADQVSIAILPTIKSPILVAAGARKVPNADQIMSDPNQIKKYFGSFIWNYFRQILLENEITHHDKKQMVIFGPADKVTADATFALLRDVGAYCVYDRRGDPVSTNHAPVKGSHYQIECDPLRISPDEGDFDARYQEFRFKLLSVGGEIRCGTNSIAVKDLRGQAPFLEMSSPVKDEVQVNGNTATTEDGEAVDPIANLEDQTVLPDSIHSFEEGDTLTSVKYSLPDETQVVFELLTGTGENYDKFVLQYPDTERLNNGIPHQNRIAEFLKTTTKAVKEHTSRIRLQLIRQGVATEDGRRRS